MSTMKLSLAVVFCACLLVPGVFGSTISQNCLPQVPTTQPISWTLTCTINQFNTTLGNLNSVTLQIFDVGGTVQPQQTNISGSDLTFLDSVATMTVKYFENGSSTLLVSVSNTSPACAGTVLAHTTNTTCPNTPYSGLSSSSYSDPNLAFYKGVGVGTVTMKGNGSMTSASGDSIDPLSGGALFFGGDGTTGGRLNVIYDYSTGVPEPATLSLMGGALLGLGFLLRRKRS